MHLYFVRHGLATWPSWPGQDAERPLTAEGVRLLTAAAAGLARRLHRDGPPPEKILHSPLLRARQTAEILGAALALDGAVVEQRLLGPGFDFKAFKVLLKDNAAAASLMFIGHNPDLGDVAARLTERPMHFREGTVARLRLRQPDSARLDWLATTDDLAGEV